MCLGIDSTDVNSTGGMKISPSKHIPSFSVLRMVFESAVEHRSSKSPIDLVTERALNDSLYFILMKPLSEPSCSMGRCIVTLEETTLSRIEMFHSKRK